MRTRVGSTFSGNPGLPSIRMGVRVRRPPMSEKQLQAYLVARETVRRAQRASEFFQPGLARFHEGGTRP